MILYHPMRERLEGEFLGRTPARIILDASGTPREIFLDPRIRAIVVATAFELEHALGAGVLITRILTSWEKEDEIYPDRVEAWGRGYVPGKPYGPHVPGRAVDWIPVRIAGSGFDLLGPGDRFYERAIARGTEYQNERFPYGWNNPSRLVAAGGAIKRLTYKTALRHTVRRVNPETGKEESLGDHIHSQISW